MSGCHGGEAGTSATRLDPSEFVDIMVELRAAERALQPSDSTVATFEERKQEILSRHHVTEADVRRFMEVHAGDLQLMAEVWDSITQQLRYARGDSAAVGPLSAPAPSGRTQTGPPPRPDSVSPDSTPVSPSGQARRRTGSVPAGRVRTLHQ